jgi:DNA helicase-2/ATP-dependent DNA helicase PcrA
LGAKFLWYTDEIKPKPRGALRTLIEDFERWRAQLGAIPASDLAAVILDESHYTEMWQHDTSPEAPGRLDNLKELVNGLQEFENLQGFLEHVSLVMDNEENSTDQKVNLMTLHAAKGLEFDTVFLPGWEEGLFPSQRTMDESGLTGLEEERRLAYVGITRARHEARISYAANRRIYNQWQNALPSRFLAELPDAHVERSAARGLGATPGTAQGSGRSLGELASTFLRPQPGGARRSRDGLVLDGESWLVPDSSGGSRFDAGARVFHQKFGYGRVLSAEGNKLEVAFDKSGTKRVIDSFVEPA